MSDSLPRGFGPYVLRRVLGAGAGGTAYLARPHEASQGWPKQLVVKVLRKEAQRDRDFVRRFEHEARIAVRVDHPNVVRMLDAGEADEQLYLTMEFVDGFMLSTIRNGLDDGATLPIDVALGIVLQLLEGIVALHDVVDDDGERIEFVHRDLSPRNVMVDATGLVRVIDFGLGKSTLQDWKTRAGTTLGSAGYMPPEQVAGDNVDQKADLYAIGAIAYELVSGRRLIPTGSPLDMLHATLAHKYVPTTSTQPGIPTAVDEIIRRATATQPSHRFESAREMLEALRATGVRLSSRTRIASVIHERYGPVEPVELDDDSASTALTESQAYTRVVARRDGLIAPAIEVLMYQETRADIAHPDPADFAFLAPPAPTTNRQFIIFGVLAATAFIVGTLALLAFDKRSKNEQTEPQAAAHVPGARPPVTFEPVVTPKTEAPVDAPTPTHQAKRKTRIRRPAPPPPRTPTVRTSPPQPSTTSPPQRRSVKDEAVELSLEAGWINKNVPLSEAAHERLRTIVMGLTVLENADDNGVDARRKLRKLRAELDSLR